MFLLGNNLGENKDDLVKLNWFRGDTPMGTNARPSTLQTVIKAKMIMRLGNIKEQLGALHPIHKRRSTDYSGKSTLHCGQSLGAHTWSGNHVARPTTTRGRLTATTSRN